MSLKLFAKYAMILASGNAPDISYDAFDELVKQIEEKYTEEQIMSITYQIQQAASDKSIMTAVGMYPPKSTPFDINDATLDNNMEKLLDYLGLK